jgi:hypothetical protein
MMQNKPRTLKAQIMEPKPMTLDTWALNRNPNASQVMKEEQEVEKAMKQSIGINMAETEAH